MKRAPVLAATLVLLLASACVYTYRLEQKEHVSQPAAGIAEFQVASRNGGIELSATTDSTITASVTKVCYGRDRADAEEAIKNITVLDTVNGSRYSVKADMPSGQRSYGASFEAAAPGSTALKLSTSNGSVSVDGFRAGASVLTSNGRILTTGTAGDLVLHTSNGAVTVRVHEGAVDIVTSNGGIDCDIVDLEPSEAATVSSTNAAVILLLPADVSARFEAETSNGSITVSGFGTVNYSLQERTHVVGTLGSGAAAVSIETSNGDVAIRAR